MTNAAEWEREVAPKLTYDALADFIADRVPLISFAPIEIAGHRCAKAGAFFGVREIIGRGSSARRRFAPSTTICSELTRSEVEHVWNSMAWMCPSPPPALRTCWSDRIASSAFLWVFAMAGTGFAFLCAGEPDLFLVFCVVTLIGLVPYLLLRRFEKPLPDGIETFGDLARRLAEANDSSTIS